MSPTGVVGLSVSAIKDLLDIYEVEDKREVFDYIFYMFNYVETRITKPEEVEEANNGTD